jgi:uncharacterized protein DUF1707
VRPPGGAARVRPLGRDGGPHLGSSNLAGAILTDVSVPVDPEQNPPEPRPAPSLPRIGDAERDRAVGFLQEHMAQGRLDHEEFDERLSRALQARTEADLQPLFEDLPEPRPSNGLATTAPFSPPPWAGVTPPAAVPAVPAGASSVPATSQGTPRWVQLVMAAVWPAAILVCLGIGWNNWWVWIAAAMVTYFLRQAYPGDPPTGSSDDPPALGR